jgi:hypothetical protein
MPLCDAQQRMPPIGLDGADGLRPRSALTSTARFADITVPSAGAMLSPGSLR